MKKLLVLPIILFLAVSCEKTEPCECASKEEISKHTFIAGIRFVSYYFDGSDQPERGFNSKVFLFEENDFDFDNSLNSINENKMKLKNGSYVNPKYVSITNSLGDCTFNEILKGKYYMISFYEDSFPVKMGAYRKIIVDENIDYTFQKIIHHHTDNGKFVEK